MFLRCIKNQTKKKNSLTFRIFLGTFLVGTSIYLISALLFTFNSYKHFELQLISEFKTEASFLENYIEKNHLTEFTDFNTENRITLIHSDGTVFFDNKSDFTKLENHSSRIEFINAKKFGEYSTSRFSKTMMTRYIYFAKILNNGELVRIASVQPSVFSIILEMSNVLILTLILALILTVIFSKFIAKKIVEPLEKIDLDNPKKDEVYDELQTFINRIIEENFEKANREELRQQFTANVSHELKTPLTSISGFAEILKNSDLIPVDKKTVLDFSETIYKESQRMIELVNDIIKLSKLDENSIYQQKENFSIYEISCDVIEILKTSAQQKNISLELNGDKGIIFGVRTVIYEMIYNLVDNAIKYNKIGGFVKIQITTSKSDNKKFANSKKNFSEIVSLSVQDSGVGIPSNEKERIFERFYRIDKSRSKALGGTGLGLSIVKHAAKYHDATINLESKESVGSSFTVIFKNSF